MKSQKKYGLDVAIEFRNKDWFNEKVYVLLRKHNVALVTAQSSRYPQVEVLTADFGYMRFHGPKELFASSYTDSEIETWAHYINGIAKKTQRVYIYFNNDYNGYAIGNAKKLREKLHIEFS